MPKIKLLSNNVTTPKHGFSNVQTKEQIEQLRYNFRLYLEAHKISLDSTWYDAFYLYRHCKEIDFFELLNIKDSNQFQFLAYEHLLKILSVNSTAKGTNISCYIRGITLLWKYVHSDDTPYIPYKHYLNPILGNRDTGTINTLDLKGFNVNDKCSHGRTVTCKTFQSKNLSSLCSIDYLWQYGDESDWHNALNHYYDKLSPAMRELDFYLETICAEDVKTMPINDFYNFLHDNFYVWKYTGNYLTSRQEDLEKYILQKKLDELKDVHNKLFSVHDNDITECLRVATKIRGLGIAGASGLLSILFPKDFGTVDKFLIIALSKISNWNYKNEITKIDPTATISVKNGTLLIKILREKATELNVSFKTDFWTPRKIDMVLWSIER